MKSYVLKRMHWEPDPVVMERLQRFWDEALSIEGEVYKALQREGQVYGHGVNNDGLREREAEPHQADGGEGGQ